MCGSFAISMAGHDKGRVYIILEEHDEVLLLTDGDLKPLEKPKKKNRKHVQIVKKLLYNEEIVEKLAGQNKLSNEEIKRAIKLYCREGNRDVEG